MLKTRSSVQYTQSSATNLIAQLLLTKTANVHRLSSQKSVCIPPHLSLPNHPLFYFPSQIPNMAPMATRSSSKRSQGAELSSKQRSEIIQALQNTKTSKRELARQFGCHPNTIANTFKRWQERNDVESRPRTGRPLKLSPRDCRVLKYSARRDPFRSYKSLASEVVGSPSIKTLRRYLKPFGITRSNVTGERWKIKRKSK